MRAFVGIKGEYGFCMTHLMISSRCPIIVSTLNTIIELMKAQEPREKVNEQLEVLQETIYDCALEMKKMYHRNNVEEFFLFRTFMSGANNSVQFPKGIIFEGVSDEPKFIRGSGAALDLTMPILDTFLGLSDSFP